MMSGKSMIEKEFVESLIAYANNNYNKMKQRAEAAEAKLAEYEKQEPIGRVNRGAATDSNEYPDAHVVCLHEHVGWEAFQDGCELFTRPAPAVSLAELVPHCLVDALCNLDLAGVSIGDKAIIAKAIEVLRNIEALNEAKG